MVVETMYLQEEIIALIERKWVLFKKKKYIHTHIFICFQIYQVDLYPEQKKRK